MLKIMAPSTSCNIAARKKVLPVSREESRKSLQSLASRICPLGDS
jgi:hypothetical protein